MTPAAAAPGRSTVPARIVGFVGPRLDEAWVRLVIDPDGCRRDATEGDRWGVAVHPDARVEEFVDGGTGGRALLWGRHVIDRRRPVDAVDAAQELGMAGVWFGGPTITVHTDVLGFNDLFVRRVGDTEFFSDQIEPLTRLGPSLTPNVPGWAISLGCSGFIGTATPFVEISRLDMGESLVLADQPRRRRDLPAWLTDPTLDASHDDVVDALRAVLPGRWRGSGIELPLSGGWDSRMIALGLAANRARRPRAWTIDPDTGSSNDVDIATILAQSLGLRHVIVRATGEFGQDRREVLERTEFQTWLHPWIAPLARSLRVEGAVFDGLGGDALIKDLLGHRMRSLTSRSQKLELLSSVANLGRLENPVLEPGFAGLGRDALREELQRLAGLWSGHPARWKLVWFLVRTNRVVACSPLRLYEPETEVVLPLVDPQFLKVLFAVPSRRRRGAELSRAILTELDPVLGNLRSTNEVERNPVPPAPRRQVQPEVLEDLARRIVADEYVSGLFSGQFAEALQSPRAAEALPSFAPFLFWAASFADWRTIHADRIASTPPGR